MRFVAVSRGAVNEIAALRQLQSCEFEPGDRLAQILLEEQDPSEALMSVALVEQSGGLFFFSARDEEDTECVVVDCAQAELFSGHSRSDVLLIFHKILRFSLRYWGAHTLPRSEFLIPKSTKAVLFPFPISRMAGFRIVVERQPDHARLKKRPRYKGWLLVFRSGVDEGEGPRQQPEVTVFRKALEAMPEARAALTIDASTRTVQDAARPIEVTELGPIGAQIDAHIGYDTWLRYLTTRQREFVEAPLTRPHRIQGPAGTGKTIALVLRAIHLTRAAPEEHHAVMVAHSEATRAALIRLFLANDADKLVERSREDSLRTITVTTLHRLCGELLGREIAATEFLDRDAMSSKEIQLLYVDEAVTGALQGELNTHRPLLSPEFAELLDAEDSWTLAHMFQHEISVVIKGRANESYDEYLKVDRPDVGLPLRAKGDRGFVFVVFLQYRRMLEDAHQFDTDDVVLSALGQLDTPIWRRRRAREGFHSVLVDETHLFNLNELSVFHHLTRSTDQFPIAYSADPSQSLQDRGWSDEGVAKLLAGGAEPDATEMTAVFRCSPQIIDLAFSVTSAGAGLFKNFDDPLKMASSNLSVEEERLCETPVYREYPDDDSMIAAVVDRAAVLAKELQAKKAEIGIVVFDDTLFKQVVDHLRSSNKPVQVIERRGDLEAIRIEGWEGKYVVGAADYVGGLEFSGVVLVGVDQGRVPQQRAALGRGGAAFLRYEAYSRLYVAITRAKYRVEILGVAGRGPSELLLPALNEKVLDRE